MDFGTIADWCIVVFTGLTVVILWRQGRSPPPALELIGEGRTENGVNLRFVVRNTDPHHLLWVDRVELRRPAGWRLERVGGDRVWTVMPFETVADHYVLSRVDGPFDASAVPKVSCIIRRNNNARRYSMKPWISSTPD